MTTKQLSLEPTFGLFGSEQWWTNIRMGAIPTHRLSGTITEVNMGPWGIRPIFVMVTDPGEDYTWTCEANTDEQAALYTVGMRVEVDYVVERFRHRIKAYDKEETKVILAIRVRKDE